MQYDEFEKRYTNNWFSSGWLEVSEKQPEEQEQKVVRKDIATLEEELSQIQMQVEKITQKQEELKEMSRMYS